eukprot:scaffold310633_cov18-Tisochrysis_lutea.AAC.1
MRAEAATYRDNRVQAPVLRWENMCALAFITTNYCTYRTGQVIKAVTGPCEKKYAIHTNPPSSEEKERGFVLVRCPSCQSLLRLAWTCAEIFACCSARSRSSRRSTDA